MRKYRSCFSLHIDITNLVYIFPLRSTTKYEKNVYEKMSMISERSARCLTSPRAVRQKKILAAIINSGKKSFPKTLLKYAKIGEVMCCISLFKSFFRGIEVLSVFIIFLSRILTHVNLGPLHSREINSKPLNTLMQQTLFII